MRAMQIRPPMKLYMGSRAFQPKAGIIVALGRSLQARGWPLQARGCLRQEAEGLRVAGAVCRESGKTLRPA